MDYNEYLVATEGLNNESTIQTTAYPLLSKRTPREARISGYGQRTNYAWSEVDNQLTTGLSDAKPDVFESYRKTDYPPEAVDTLCGGLAPTSYDIAMPAFAVEVKGSEGSMQVAQLQCAYDGALMTEGARAMHKYMGKSDDDFNGKTQALTVAYNGETLKFYCHHAVQIPLSSQPAGRVDSRAETAVDTVGTLRYPQCLLGGDNPRDSFESFQAAYKHTRNSEDIGYKWATERKDALWAYTIADNTQTPPDVPTSAQQTSNDSLVSVSSGTPDDYNYDAYDGVPIPAEQPTDSLVPVSSGPSDSYSYDAHDDDPTDQLLRESWTNSTANNQDFSIQITPMHNGYASSDAQTYNPISPPQSSKDVSVPLESQHLSVPTITEPLEYDDSSAHNHRRTRRSRASAAVAVEGPREVADNSKTRKTRKRR